MRQPQCIGQFSKGEFTSGCCPLCGGGPRYNLVGHVSVVHHMTREEAVKFLALDELAGDTSQEALDRYNRRLRDGKN